MKIIEENTLHITLQKSVDNNIIKRYNQYNQSNQ